MVRIPININNLPEAAGSAGKKPAPVPARPVVTKTPAEPRTKRSLTRYFVYAGIFFFTTLAVFCTQVVVSEQNTTSWLARLPIIRELKHLAESADKTLKGEAEDRINILLMGMGGKNHEGGYLTDTIILASIQPSSKKAALISVPRDLVVPMENIGWRKINHVNAYAEMAAAGSGGLAASQALADVLDQAIDYYFLVDFAAFVNIIDRLGGIDVEVENTLSDHRYPVPGREDDESYESRFEHLYVEKGWQHMDGELALKFARSRLAAGAEGSDFARARRQQIIIQAVRDKILSSRLIFDPTLAADIIGELKDNIRTNLKIWEMVKLWQIGRDISGSDIATRVLDNSPNGLLADSISEQGAYVLLPRSGDFAEIQYFVANIFADAPVTQKAAVTREAASIEVRNGTWVNGLASKVALDLERYGFDIVRIGNSNRQNFQKSVIYDLSYGAKDSALTVLKEKTGANVSLELPAWLQEDINRELENEPSPPQPDFILVLGQDADRTQSGTDNFYD